MEGCSRRQSFKAGMGFESGQKLKFKDGSSLQASINSGVSFQPGPFKNLWDKIKPQADVPINKNVKPYKPNSQ